MSGAGAFLAVLDAAAVALAGGLAWRWWKRSGQGLRAAAVAWLVLAFVTPAVAASVEPGSWPGWEPQPYVMLMWWWAFAVLVTVAAWGLWWASVRRR